MDYRTWNDNLCKFFFRPCNDGETVYLTVDADLLREISCGEFATPEEAQENFCRAVRTEIDHSRPDWRSLQAEAPLAIEKAYYPDVMGLAALQVLAVHMMTDTDNYTDQAFWPCVGQLLSFEGNPYRVPLRTWFYKNHQRLWRDWLQRWANDRSRHGGNRGWLELPAADDHVSRQHIRLPLSQALLRLEDLCNLSAVLAEQRGLREGDETLEGDVVAKELETLIRRGSGMSQLPGFLLQSCRSLASDEALRTLCAYLLEHNIPSSLLSRHALRPLSDDRSRAACDQLARHLFLGGARHEIDGTSTRSGATAVRRSLRLWLHFRQRPNTLLGGVGWLDDDKQWQKIDNVTLKSVLESGRNHHTISVPGFRPYQLSTDRPVLVVRRLDNWDVEQRRASPGDRVTLLGPTHLVDPLTAVALALAVDRQVEERQKLDNLPSGWSFARFTLRPNLDAGEIPAVWESYLHVRPGLHLEGGLLLRQSVWMIGGALQLRVSGQNPQRFQVHLDNDTLSVDETGLVQGSAARLAAPGAYFVWIQGHRRLAYRLVIEQPDLATEYASEAVWPRPLAGWPQIAARSATTEEVRGPALSGAWLPSIAMTESSRLNAIDLTRQGFQAMLRLRQPALWSLVGRPTLEQPSELPLHRVLTDAATKRENQHGVAQSE